MICSVMYLGEHLCSSFLVLRTLVTLSICKNKEKFLIKQEKGEKSENCSKKEKTAKTPNLLTSSLKMPVFIGSLGTVGVC